MCNFEITISKGNLLNKVEEYKVLTKSEIQKTIASGDDGVEETLLPIPNRKVKLYSVNGTAWVTVWESRTLPGNLGVQLSWESTCLARKGSRVRLPLPPPKLRIISQLFCVIIKNKIVKIVFNLYFLFNSGIINMNMYCKYMLKLGGKKQCYIE